MADQGRGRGQGKRDNPRNNRPGGSAPNQVEHMEIANQGQWVPQFDPQFGPSPSTSPLGMVSRVRRPHHGIKDRTCNPLS